MRAEHEQPAPLDDNVEPVQCPRCGGWALSYTCWQCGGEGEFDASSSRGSGLPTTEQDAINFAPGEEYETCSICHGEGGWTVCQECRYGRETK